MTKRRRRNNDHLVLDFYLKSVKRYLNYSNGELVG